MSIADDTEILALSERLASPIDSGQRAFRIALAVAFLVHAAALVEVGRSKPRPIGDRSGAPDAIAVDIVTEADLRSRETVALPAAGAPVPAPQPPPEPARQPEPEPEAVAPAAKQPPLKETLQETPQEKKQETATLPDFQSVLPDLATLPQPTEPAEAPSEPTKPQEAEAEPAKPAEKQAPPVKKKPAPQARLDPSIPDFSDAPPGRSAAASRPPGITRSGENDEFGRAVIRALRQTMPPPRGIFGRVTVRLLLNENGDLAEVRVVAPSGTSLDQSVVFATKQTYFPLPPYKATVADRTFLITYVYR